VAKISLQFNQGIDTQGGDMSTVDLRDCLQSWPYDEERNVRIARGADGREIILVRRPMGIEQYEADGRPDGRRVHDADTVLDFHHARMNAAEQTHSPTVWELSTEACAELFDEANAYHDRLILLFRLRDWARAGRDAVQVLRLLDTVRQHARCAEDRAQIEPWRPHITRIHAVTRAMLLLENRQHQEALLIARETPGILDAFAACTPQHSQLADVLLASVRDSLVSKTACRPREESTFIRQDDFWMIRHHGDTAFLKCTRGLQCLAILLRSPGREFHVSELLASLPDTPPATSAKHTSGHHHENGDHLVTAGLPEGIPILDAQAKAEYKRRLHELRQELEEAEQFNAPDRAAKAHEEMNVIAQQLSGAIGLGGRDRKAGSEAERARCAVTKRIKQAIEKIADAIPALGHHLAARIKTGYFCSYNPHPDRPVAWKF
jgi:hypothetical protein